MKPRSTPKDPEKRGIWRDIFPPKGPVYEATREETRKALKEVLKSQAVVIRLLEKE